MSHFICPNCGGRHEIFGNGGAQAEAALIGVPFLGEVPLEMEIRVTSDQGNPIVVSQPEGPHAQHYLLIAKKILNGLGSSQAPAPKIIFE